MALKPTIYKTTIGLSDLNRDYYDSLQLTIAQHPSETAERMMARVVAFCLHAQPELSFTKGLSAVDEPDIWARTLDNRIDTWIDVGEPAFDRIKKAVSVSQAVKIYTFNTKSNVWWSQLDSKIHTLNVSVYQFNWESIQALAALVERTMQMSVTITGESAYITSDKGECEVTWTVLKE